MSRLTVTISPPTVDADRVVLGALRVADKATFERAKVMIQNQSLSQVSSITIEGLTNAQAALFAATLASVGGRFSVTTKAEFDPAEALRETAKPLPMSVSVAPTPAVFVASGGQLTPKSVEKAEKFLDDRAGKKAKTAKPDYGAMSKAELQAACVKRGLAKYGTKDALIERLEADNPA